MNNKSAVEILNDDSGAIDEIVIQSGLVHVERMSVDGWFLGVHCENGDFWQFWFGSKNRKSQVEFRHVEYTPADKK